MDGTAGRQFSTLRRRLQQLGIELVITHLPPARCVHMHTAIRITELHPLDEGVQLRHSAWCNWTSQVRSSRP